MTSPSLTRPSWESYFLHIAEAVATRADCRRRQAGCVLVSPDQRIVGTGYNGAPAGTVGCLAGGCPRGLLSMEELAPYSSYDSGPGACVAIHAEGNALLHADRKDTIGATAYMVPGAPCAGCVRLLAGAGIDLVVWRTDGVVFTRTALDLFEEFREAGLASRG